MKKELIITKGIVAESLRFLGNDTYSTINHADI